MLLNIPHYTKQLPITKMIKLSIVLKLRNLVGDPLEFWAIRADQNGSHD